MTDALAVIPPDDEPDEEPGAALTLFGTADPVAVLAKAAQVAAALKGVIDRQGLYTVIGTKQHVHVEGWTLLGSMLGVFAHIEWTHKLEDGWEARAVATRNGQVVGAGEPSARTTRSAPWRRPAPSAEHCGDRLTSS
jgi:hypothetical protein